MCYSPFVCFVFRAYGVTHSLTVVALIGAARVSASARVLIDVVGHARLSILGATHLKPSFRSSVPVQIYSAPDSRPHRRLND